DTRPQVILRALDETGLEFRWNGQLPQHYNSSAMVHRMIVAQETTVCAEGVVDTTGGDIVIHTGTVIHPGAIIKAASGPVHIGENCVIEEGVTIINDGDSGAALVIGNNCLLEFGSHVGSECVLGDGVVLECKAKVAAHCQLGHNVCVGAACAVAKGDTLPDNTAVYGKECYRRTMHQSVVALRQSTLTGLLLFLRTQLPKGNNIRPATD
ncbi:hypothetical protein SARC_11783, partial [Sphaeroforma arctica JP610]